uniref:Uncharacterized protein n=1 Tax=Anguilla anguilla TaxID=7936 RepID=A0A0E9ULS6_ANGAN
MADSLSAPRFSFMCKVVFSILWRKRKGQNSMWKTLGDAEEKKGSNHKDVRPHHSWSV